MLARDHIIRSALTTVDNWSKAAIFEDEGDGIMLRPAPLSTVSSDVLNSQIDWSQCAAVQRTAGILSGEWRVKGTRIPVEAIIQNYNAGYEPEEMATRLFVGLPIDLAREIIKYAAQKR